MPPIASNQRVLTPKGPNLAYYYSLSASTTIPPLFSFSPNTMLQTGFYIKLTCVDSLANEATG